MRPTVEQLVTFYASPLGRRVTAQLLRRLSVHLSRRADDRVLGLGYAVPFLHPLIGKVERLIAAMPERQGVCAWPEAAANSACLVDELRLPFADALFDQVVVAHALEFTDPARRMLREVWRVLAPAGRLIVLAPNRAGLWMHFERTPFGHGCPFGPNQLRALLAESLFSLDHHETMLVMPPHAPLVSLERPMRALLPNFGGVHLAVASKADGQAPVKGQARPVHRLAEAPV